MSETRKLPKALTWFAMGSGVLCLLYGALFLVGKSFYGAYGPTMGYQLWYRCCRPALFMTATNNGWRYSDLDREQWMSVKLESIDHKFFSPDGWMSCRFRRADGTCFDTWVRWVMDYDLIPVIGQKYRIKVWVTLEDNALANKVLGHKGITQWFVSHSIREVTEEH